MRCEWLSFFLSLTRHNNLPDLLNHSSSVVNGFHFSYLWLVTTTAQAVARLLAQLWMAFIFLIFDSSQQLEQLLIILEFGCEWLSFFLSLTRHNNKWQCRRIAQTVVNGFHFSYLWLVTTTYERYQDYWQRLWMAFIFLIFDSSQQRRSRNSWLPISCEWLSFFLSLTRHNNTILTTGLRK